MKKKILAIVLCVAMLAIAIVGGTMAYFTDTKSQANTMTVGSVKIEQWEYQRAKEDGKYVTTTVDGKTSYKLEGFAQDKAMMPCTEVDNNGDPVNFGAGDWDTTLARMSQVGSQGGMQVFSNENAVDKFVVVKNAGKSDAYVRTLIAFECGSKNQAEWGNLVRTSVFMKDQGVWNTTFVGIAAIDRTNYVVYEYVYGGGAHLGGVHEEGVLPAGEMTYPSLAQVYMTAAATNEDVEALDGNKNGKYDILVLSQAVQADGFDDAATALKAAFGEADVTNVTTWFTAE